MNLQNSILRSKRAALAIVAVLACSFAQSQTFSCTTSIGPAVAFGIYDASASVAGSASTNATLMCTHLSGGTVRIAWDMQISNGSSGNCGARRMQGPSDTLAYNVYQDAVVNGVWGNAGCQSYPSGQFTLSNGAGNNVRTITHTLAGQLPAGQFNAGAGSYSDTLTVTITYNPL